MFNNSYSQEEQGLRAAGSHGGFPSPASSQPGTAAAFTPPVALSDGLIFLIGLIFAQVVVPALPSPGSGAVPLPQPLLGALVVIQEF